MCKGIGVNKKTERSAKRTENKREEKKTKKPTTEYFSFPLPTEYYLHIKSDITLIGSETHI